MAIACQARSFLRPRHTSSAAPGSLIQPLRAQRVLAHPERNGVGVQQQEDVGPLVEEAAAAAHGLFNPEFKTALADALKRSGSSALLSGPGKFDESRISASEEVLLAAISTCRSTLLKLQLIQKETTLAIEAEQKQLERMQFALEKARNDAAFYKTLNSYFEEGATSD